MVVSSLSLKYLSLILSSVQMYGRYSKIQYICLVKGMDVLQYTTWDYPDIKKYILPATFLYLFRLVKGNQVPEHVGKNTVK